MPHIACIICGGSFYAKPSHLLKGWGKYCSKKCQFEGQRTGTIIKCHTCNKQTYKNANDQLRSKSGSLFCGKSCQTKWRNEQYSREKHSNWVNGKASYRAALLRSSVKQECTRCHITDGRILAVHHRDKNRFNNDLSNLTWLCHNCHYLIHHDKREAEGFVVPVA